MASVPSSPQCKLSADDRVANRKLTVKDFDQQGTLPSTARALAERKCFAEAVEANIDYLLHGPDLADHERNVVRFHTGQYLASSGKESEAALVIATTRRGTDDERQAAPRRHGRASFVESRFWKPNECEGASPLSAMLRPAVSHRIRRRPTL
jgi:hypothetical protein